MKDRIQKVLAATGLYSRRQVEALIKAGKVKVNGVVLHEMGFKIDPDKDRVHVGPKIVSLNKTMPFTVVLFNKPRQVVVTRSDPEDRATVYEYLPKELHTLKPIGRLDFNSQGALLLTNDGDLILKLTHPRYHFPKVYEVKLSSHPEEFQLKKLRQGVIIDGERTLPAEVEIIEKRDSSTLAQITLREGKNRQIRRMCDAVGLTVKELRRVKIGSIKLGHLRSGQYRFLTKQEMRSLLSGHD